jgi:hypothetical protein
MSARECQSIWKYVAYQLPSTAFTTPSAAIPSTNTSTTGSRARPSYLSTVTTASPISNTSSSSSVAVATSSSEMMDEDSDIDGEGDSVAVTSQRSQPVRRSIATIVEDSGLGVGMIDHTPSFVALLLRWL